MEEEAMVLSGFEGRTTPDKAQGRKGKEMGDHWQQNGGRKPNQKAADVNRHSAHK